jgi:class 3 adenylate cyclase
MPAVSFRIKLLLAMMLVVVGVTGATLYISQQKFQAYYRELFTELFQNQNKAFSDKQRQSLESIKQACATLVASPRLQLALSEAMGGETEGLYRQAKAELETRRVLSVDSANANALHATFFLFLDAKGQVIPPPESFAQFKQLTGQQRLKEQLGMVGLAISEMEQPVVGFITPQAEDGALQLQQAVFTRVIDKPTGEILGALALGFPMPDLGKTEQGKYKFKAGILFEARLYSQSIQESKRDVLARRVTDQIKITEQPPEDFIEAIEGDPHRIFYQALNPDPHFPTAHLVALLSSQKALEAQRDLRAWIFFFGGLGLAGALALSLLLSHGLSVPIQELVTGTAEIQRGNFEIQVPVRSRDEIGRLAIAFNEMTVGLAQKEKYRSVLDKVSDPAVAEELMRGNVALGGETREVSVLFCDIRGFTALSQGMNPNEVIRMLNEHFTPLTRVVNEHHGVVDKFVGDLIMAIFGAPKSYGNDAANAAHCALAMIHQRQRLNETSKYTIHIGIGVASGPAVAGNMGSADRLNYTVLGERVNLASRLCGKADRMEVVIDQTTQQRLSGLIRAEPLPELELKGFSSRVQAYKLLEVRSLQPSV